MPQTGETGQVCVSGEPRNPTGLFSRPKVSRPTHPKRVLSESPQHTTHHLVSAQKMPVKDTCQRGKQRTGEKPAPGVAGRRVTCRG